MVVDLSRALSSAPSYAALGWLETSIKTYAMFVDVAAKATSVQDGEQAEIRREVQSIGRLADTSKSVRLAPCYFRMKRCIGTGVAGGGIGN